MKINSGFTGLAFVLLAVFLYSSPASADVERLSVSYEYTDDGSCGDKPGNTIQGAYRLASATLDVYGSARTNPSGGDCRVDSLSYTIEVEKRFRVNALVSAMAKFGADERSSAAPYALVDGMDMVLTRPDGGASNPLVLPAGSTKTIEGVFGASFDVGMLNIDLGYNLVPADWADGSEGTAFHAAASTLVGVLGGELDATVAFNKGNGAYGDARVTWSRSFMDSAWGAQVGATYAWGLNELDNGAPETQMFAGLPTKRQGAPQDDAATMFFGLTVEL